MMIPYGRQSVDEADIDAVVQVLRSDFLTQGPLVPAFEEAVARTVGAEHAVAMNSATSALHLACLALGVGPGDSVWTVPNTFVASANCARYCGAEVDFVDIDDETWNISIVALADKLAAAETAGVLPKVLIPVHFAGQSCDMAAIGALAEQYGLHVIEDASHAIGATYQGEPVGNCRHSQVTVFSFHPVKIITTGEGGVAVTNDPEIAWKMSTLRTHGVTREAARMEAVDAAPWVYEQQMLGYNYRMIDLEAALGLSQLTRLSVFIDRRNALAARYGCLLASLPVQLPKVKRECRSAFHLYVIRLEQRDAQRHRQIFEALRTAGIGVNLHYTPVHLQPYYRQRGFAESMYPQSEFHGESAITLPLYPDLSEEQQDEVVAAVRRVFASDAAE